MRPSKELGALVGREGIEKALLEAEAQVMLCSLGKRKLAKNKKNLLTKAGGKPSTVVDTCDQHLKAEAGGS